MRKRRDKREDTIGRMKSWKIERDDLDKEGETSHGPRPGERRWAWVCKWGTGCDGVILVQQEAKTSKNKWEECFRKHRERSGRLSHLLRGMEKDWSHWGLGKERKVAQSCPTLCDPMDCSLPGFSVLGIFQARVLEWVAISFSRGSSRPKDRTRVSLIVGRRFTQVCKSWIYNRVNMFQ